jgi:hypothetical protein
MRTIKFEITGEKLVETTKEPDALLRGEYIIRKYHKLTLSQEDVDNVMWWAIEHFDYGDDPECDWGRGLHTSQPDGDLDFIEMDNLLEAIKDYLDYEGKDMWEDDELLERQKEFDALKKYAGYTLRIDRITDDENLQ